PSSENEDPAAYALDCEVATPALRQAAGCACQQRPRAVGAEAEHGEDHSKQCDLHRDVPATQLDELRQEREEEQRRLRIEQVHDEAIAKQARVAVARHLAVRAAV